MILNGIEYRLKKTQDYCDGCVFHNIDTSSCILSKLAKEKKISMDIATKCNGEVEDEPGIEYAWELTPITHEPLTLKL